MAGKQTAQAAEQHSAEAGEHPPKNSMPNTSVLAHATPVSVEMVRVLAQMPAETV